MTFTRITIGFMLLLLAGTAALADELKLNELGYFEKPGLNVMVFSDFYPDGHQTGVTIIQHGVRVAANGDLRLEAAPGQWSPMPATGKRSIDGETISQTLSYPDPTKNRTGYNPIDYPDLKFSYHVRVTPLTGGSFKITVDLDQPLPQAWIGKVGFNFELFPGSLFGKAYLMNDQAGIFPTQPEGPLGVDRGEIVAKPLAIGNTLIVAPNEDKQRLTIESRSSPLQLVDGRTNANNGWFVVRSLIPAGAAKGAIEWVVTPNVIPDWRYQPVIQVSQVGYAPEQPKRVIIEQDKLDAVAAPVVLYKLGAAGRQEVLRGQPSAWGRFLRYNYYTFDFSGVTEPGMYVIGYRSGLSHPFKIGADVFDRHVWQPTLEYFLPVQMCHMLVREKYRVWHGLDHQDDALMSPINHDHFDGYAQGPSTLTKYKPLQHVPGLDAGGWHDAGDYDLRVESQMGTVWLLSKMVTEFGLNYDATLIDQKRKLVEIHVPDGKNDAQQQIEHGLLSVLGAYRSMGRLYRGIQDANLQQYVLLGDVSVNSDGLLYDPKLPKGVRRGGHSATLDDRFVFTEDNPDRELTAAAGLAAASVALRNYNAKLSAEALADAKKIFAKAVGKTTKTEPVVFALSELILATGDKAYVQQLIGLRDKIIADISNSGWAVGQVIGKIDDPGFVSDLTKAVAAYQKELRESSAKESPYGVPYKPNIWGAGWTIQELAVKQYFFRKGWPTLTPADIELNALNFDLGVHPGENTESFASGVGSVSATVAYGANRADWSFIPGGVISGTALIRPDLPELKVWPYFWQQSEYVMGGGETNYMFLVLDANALYSKNMR